MDFYDDAIIKSKYVYLSIEVCDVDPSDDARKKTTIVDQRRVSEIIKNLKFSFSKYYITTGQNLLPHNHLFPDTLLLIFKTASYPDTLENKTINSFERATNLC